jgi:hypothetical protein
MAAAIAICILSSAWLFGRIEPYVSDFTGYEQNTPVPAVAAASNDDEETPVPDDEDSDDLEPTQVPEATEASGDEPTTAPATTATTTAFEQTHESNPDFTVNFRPGPSIDSGEPVATLDPGTPLQYLDEQTTGDDGSIWLLMKSQDDIQGWLREVDTVPAN